MIRTLRNWQKNRIFTFYLLCTQVIEMCFHEKEIPTLHCYKLFQVSGNDRNLQARGHSSNTWTKYTQFWPPPPIEWTIVDILCDTYLKWPSVDFLLTPSPSFCPRSYWMAPNWNVETDKNKAAKIWRNVPVAHFLFFKL